MQKLAVKKPLRGKGNSAKVILQVRFSSITNLKFSCEQMAKRSKPQLHNKGAIIKCTLKLQVFVLKFCISLSTNLCKTPDVKRSSFFFLLKCFKEQTAFRVKEELWNSYNIEDAGRGDSECNSTTKAGTATPSWARIYDITGWVNAGNGYNASKNRCWTLNLSMKLGCFSESSIRQLGPHSLKTGWVGGCGYILYVSVWTRGSVKRMKNRQEYCSVLRVQFSMNQKQLSWLPFHALLSARKWDFFHIFCR